MGIANFFVAASATMILPFLSLYIDTFGDFSEAYVQRWSGFVFGITFLVAFVVSPFWGRFGDKFGRKKILLLTGYGIAISIFLMGYVQSVLGLFLLRFFMGVVTGFIPTSLALISAQTKKDRAGKVLGTLQMGTVSGGLIGPLIGGALADTFGFTYTFLITSLIITAATTVVLFGINEMVVKEQNKKQKETRSMLSVLKMIFQNKVLLMIMIISFLIQTANFSIQPQLALYVNNLMEAENIALLAGFAFSVTGLGNLLFTRSWGVLGDRIGHEKVLLITLSLGGLFFLPQAFVTNIWQLVIFRFLFGAMIGGIIPCVTAYIRQAVPLSVQGEILGYNQSFRFLGNVVGPVIGGLISSLWSISFVFYFSAIVIFITVLSLGLILKNNHGNMEEGSKLTGS
ncbi:MFS transporter [Evansella sp. AB-P1]|uniref:MFS transporter n=1 Tax=Evansella sp. AB-P1 TaxID=3037653 RepID=UPI00241EF1F4|nr:MFS transporter [Evansella sp. AB-P1]MDG5787524.1 MFS transporter [Evansella sp. AB-P1]